MIEFTFPVQQILNITSLSNARSLINCSLQLQNLDGYCTYQFREVRGIYIYCKCRDCAARLVFKKNNDTYKLFKAKTQHKHRRNVPRKSVVTQAIKPYPLLLGTSYIKQMILSRFKISQSTFYRYFRQLQSAANNVDDVLKLLLEEGIFGVKIQDKDLDLPSILLLTSQLMIQRYKENGRNIKFDLTYNIIRQEPTQGRQYAVGIFASLNNNLNIQPLCLVIMADESKDSFIRVFLEFFILMRSPPCIIITDQQIAMRAALEQLHQRRIWTGYHFIDLFHVIRNAKKGLFNKSSINDLATLSKSSNLIEYQKARDKCNQNFHSRDKAILQKFEQKMESCCLALLPPIFIGLSCSTNSSQKLNDLIKSKLPISVKYVFAVDKMARFLLNMLKLPRKTCLQKAKIEQFTTISEIEVLRLKLCKKVFRKLMLELSLSMGCLINIGEASNSFQVREQDFEDNQYFIVNLDSEAGKWKCSCRLGEKIGIPCSHILKVLLLKKQKLISGINPWWIIQQNELPQKLEIIKFPRKTRRNFK